MKKRSLKTYLTLLAFLLSFAMLFAILPMQSIAEGEPVETTAAEENSGMPAETLPNPDYDPDADPTVTDPPTLEPIGNAGGGDAEPTIIDPGIGGGGGIPIGPVNTPLDSGVYTIVNAANQKAVDVRAGGTTAGTVVQQYTDYGSTVNRNQLFKVTYLTSVNGFHYYTIRSMTNSALGLTVDASGVVLDDIGTSDQYANVASNDRWVITVYDTGIYSIQTTNNLGGYLTTGGSTANEHQLSTATSTSTNTRWTFREYEGETIEGYGWHSAPTEVILGESVTYSAYMYSTESWRNGPVTYSLYMDGDTVDNYATIDAATGVLTALNGEDIQVRVLPYANAPWYGYKNVEVLFNNQIIHTLRNVNNGELLMPSSANLSTPIITDEYNMDAISSMWYLIYHGDGYFKIQNYVTERYVTAASVSVSGGQILHDNFSTIHSLWKITKTSDGYYVLQNKSQSHYPYPEEIGYLAILNGEVVLTPSAEAAYKWDISPLTLTLNVMYDEGFVDKYPLYHMDVLNGLYFDTNSNGLSLKKFYRERFGLKLEVEIASSTHTSYPYAQNCDFCESLGTWCLGYNCSILENSVSAPSLGLTEAELKQKHYNDCQNGHHHTRESKFLDTIPENPTGSKQLNILHTGHIACDSGIGDDGIYHAETAYGRAVTSGTSITIYNHHFDFAAQNATSDQDAVIRVIAHETCHSLGVPHCTALTCIMTESKDPDADKSVLALELCEDCLSEFEANKFRLYES